MRAHPNALRLPTALILLALAAGPVRSQSPTPALRSEIPIQAVMLSDDVVRFGVALTIGKTPVLAGIDTGAAGLRVMPDALPKGEARAGETSEAYNFGSGTRLAGVAGQAKVTIGALVAPMSLHLVQKVDCVPKLPRCPGLLDLGYGFLGDGLPHEGFRVLLGANMGRTSIDNPLIAAGARRWIIELPRPGEAAPGRLVLNPTDEEVAGFAMLRLLGGYREEEGGGLHDAVWGCLHSETSKAPLCGPVALDTGAYSVRAFNAPAGALAWPAGSAMTLDFQDEQRKTAASVKMIVGRAAQSLGQDTAPIRGVILEPGVAPYFAYDVLYDPVRRMLGFKARPPVEGLPQAGAG